MGFEIFLAIRFLRTPRRSGLARFTSLAAIVGITCGTAAMIFAQTLADGFRLALQNGILANTAHISIFRTDGENIADWQNLRQQIAQIDGVNAVSAASLDNALLIGENNSSYALLRGFQSLKSEGEQSKVPNSKLKIAIGKILAEKTNLHVGADAEIISGAGKPNEKFVPVSTTVTVDSIFSTGLYEYDSTWIKVDLATAAKLTGQPNLTVSALEVKTSDLYLSDRVAQLMREKFGANYKILDWQEANQPLFAALSLERRLMLLVISLIILIAALNIATTMALVTAERKEDIAVLKTCGARGQSIILIFLLAGAFLGIIGILLGSFFGITACFAADYFHLTNLPSDVYSISRINLEPSLSEILLTVAAIFLVCLTASAFPAWRAIRVKPARILK